MDHVSQRESLRDWIELGRRNHLTFKDLSRRSGWSERTLRRWSKRFRREGILQDEPDQDDHAFVDILEGADRAASRIEIVMPGRRRIVVSGSVLITALVRLFDTGEQC
jgi:transposase-like protein